LLCSISIRVYGVQKVIVIRTYVKRIQLQKDKNSYKKWKCGICQIHFPLAIKMQIISRNEFGPNTCIRYKSWEEDPIFTGNPMQYITIKKTKFM